MKMISRAGWILFPVSTIVIACAAPRSASRNGTGGPMLAPTGQNAAATQSGTRRESVQVDARIAEACALPETYFPFDSDSIDGNAARALDTLARCFVSGPLKGRAMKLVGHADPRGEAEYNFGLGQERAASVAHYLQGRGVDAPRMATSSHGEVDATGIDEVGWARDRKVQILLSD
jgi:peptidoglycan-associated lipoprotein